MCLLQHYIERKNIHGFSYMIARMVGRSAYGINKRRKEADDVFASKFLRAWASECHAIEHDGFYVEPAKFGGGILDSIIRGLTQFDFLREAAQVFLHCLRYSVAISSDTVYRLFDRCVTSVDPKAARLILGGLRDNLNQVPAFFGEYSRGKTCTATFRPGGVV